ncbi:hypothetical protein AcV7_007440 [Taiwanofungus camphoratus]|nr:hypothetical protein AcV7_007440 [Antrodia cinnamomea]
MQAIIDSASLRHLTRSLTCLSRYGDEMTIYATPEILALSSTNSSKSAYCRFKYSKQFFSRYSVGVLSASGVYNDSIEEVPTTTGQLLTKSLLSILKHKTVEKTVDKCELSIVDPEYTGQAIYNDENADTLESRLIVRLHCKHGVIKTHRLLLQVPTSLLAPGVPDTPYQSRLTIGPRPLREMIEHFPNAKGSKSDPQLVWSFGDTEVQVKSLETSIDTKGKAQLSTELTISADEFDDYNVCETPVTVAFHLREFNATIAFAEASALALDIRFTNPSEPLFIDVEGDLSETLFVIATSQVPGTAGGISGQVHQMQSKGKKRELEEDTDPSVRGSRPGSGAGDSRPPAIERKKPMKVVQATDRMSLARELHGESPSVCATPRSVRGSMPPPSFPAPLPVHSQEPGPSARPHEPLFLPSSQLSQADQEAIRESGLGIEYMSAQEFEEMLEGEGEEVAFGPDMVADAEGLAMGVGQDDLDIFDEMEMEPTQNDGQTKVFKPLFED